MEALRGVSGDDGSGDGHAGNVRGFVGGWMGAVGEVGGDAAVLLHAAPSSHDCMASTAD